MKYSFFSILIAAALSGLLPATAKAQVLDSENKLSVTLNDGTQVILYAKAGDRPGVKTAEYYYLPTALRLSRNDGGEPQFLFMKFLTDARDDNGGVSGALLHFLMEWGLNEKQMSEAQEKARQKVPGAKVMGPIQVEKEGEGSYKLTSASLSTPGQTLNVSGDAPVFPGGKVATAARMDKAAAQLIANSFDKAKSDISLTLRFKFRVLMPAAKGRIVINWRKIYEKYQKDSAAYRSNRQTTSYLWGLWSTTSVSSQSYAEVRKEMQSLIDEKYIEFQFDELDPNSEKVKPIREAFMTVLTQMIGDLGQSRENRPASPEEEAAMPDIKSGTSYRFVRERLVRNTQVGRQELNLNVRMSYYLCADITQDIASWYNDLKSNPRCVSSVLLNDPFYTRRDMNFVLDDRAKEMFDDKEVNYVTVNVRKRRSSGGDFTDRFTIDKESLTKKGMRASLTYARGEDTNPEEFEYQSQWSFAGGFVYPQTAAWEKGTWETNPLAAPLQLQKLEFQTDLEKLKEAKIVRATLQVRYKKLGEEREMTVPLSASGSDFLVTKNVYTDRDLDGFVYRLIYYTSDGERLATAWSPKRSDWFVYAAVPDELRDKTSEIFQKAIETGKVIAGTVEGGKVPPADKVLDKFKDVLGIVTN